MQKYLEKCNGKCNQVIPISIPRLFISLEQLILITHTLSGHLYVLHLNPHSKIIINIISYLISAIFNYFMPLDRANLFF